MKRRLFIQHSAASVAAIATVGLISISSHALATTTSSSTSRCVVWTQCEARNSPAGAYSICTAVNGHQQNCTVWCDAAGTIPLNIFC